MNVHGVVLAHCYVNYRIAGNFRERKLSWISRFCGYSRKFSLRNLEAWHPLKQAIRESFLHENRILHQFARVFFLKSFPLYGSTQNLLAHMIHECVRLKNPKCEFCYGSVNVCIHVCSLADLCHALVDGTKGVIVGWQWCESGDVCLLYLSIDMGEKSCHVLAHSIQVRWRGVLVKGKTPLLSHALAVSLQYNIGNDVWITWCSVSTCPLMWWRNPVMFQLTYKGHSVFRCSMEPLYSGCMLCENIPW